MSINRPIKTDEEHAAALARRGQLMVSAREGLGIDRLLLAIDEALTVDPIVEAEFCVPQDQGAVLAAIDAGMIVHERSYDCCSVYLRLSGPSSLVGRLRRFRVHDGAAPRECCEPKESENGRQDD